MKRICFAVFAFLLFSSHDMFLKMDSYFLTPKSEASIQLFNGTFHASENTIDRNRMSDVSLVGKGRRIRVDSTQWRALDSVTVLDFTTGESGTWVAGVSTRARNIELAAEDFNDYLEHDGVLDMLQWRKENDALEKDAVEKYSKHVKAIFQVGDTKTEDWQTPLCYPIEFIPLNNPYDMHPGHEIQFKLLWQGKPLPDQLVYVGSDSEGQAHAHDHEHSAQTEQEHDHEHTGNTGHSHESEKGHSHQDGTTHTHGGEKEHTHEDGTTHTHSQEKEHTHEDGTKHSHTQEREHTHEDKTTHSHGQEHQHADGTTHSHGHSADTKPEHQHENEEAEAASEDHRHLELLEVRTNSEGLFKVPLTATGKWYLRTIYMTHSEEAGLTHESNWATLTFAVGEGHSHEGEDHDHAEEHSHEIPSYVYWIGSLVVIAGLFFWFNRKNK